MDGSTDGSSPPARVPTVVVARRARAGAEEDLRRALERIARAAEQADGSLGAEVQPPGEAHPGEWVVVYRFRTFAHLHAWLGSAARRAELAELDPLIDGPARQQVVAVPATADPVTAVSSVRLKPGAERAYRRHHARIVQALREVPGFQRAQLLEPVGGHQEELVTVLVFDDRPALEGWLASPQRAALLAELEPLVEGERSVTVVGGWAGWFAPAGTGDAGAAAAPPRWKQALVVLAALFPVSLATGAARAALLPDLPLAPSTLLANVVGIVVLTWLVMPPLTRLLAGWLAR